MRLLVAGSRGFTDYDEVAHVLSNASHCLDRPVTLVISGGARGVDRHAEWWAFEWNYPMKVMPAEWDRYGKSAGYRRNVEMVEECDAAIVLWDGESRGTKHTMDLLAAKGIPRVIVVRGIN